MIVCPVCEHQQAHGESCDNCGKQLVAPRPINIASAPLPGLETTAIPGGNANVVDAPLPELEPHHVGAVAAPAEALAGMERTRVADDPTRTPVRAVHACRYCGNTQRQAGICERCGMKIAVYRPAAPQAEDEPTILPCPSCGVKGASNSNCISCGAFIRRPEL